MDTTSNQRFLTSVGTWTLTDSDKQPFRGIGLNLCWESRDQDDSAHFARLHEHPRFSYAVQIPRLAAMGVNFLRVWMCHWNLCVDWPRPANNRRYRPSAAGERFNRTGLDALLNLVKLCEAHGVRLMLCLETHVNFMGEGWALNPYNAANGGPAATPLAFFRLETARAKYREKLRCVVDAVGSSPAIAVWEFFNEIDNLTFHPDFGGASDDPSVCDWHRDMATYLRSIDPARRPVSTSVSHRELPGLWDRAGLDFNQHHMYCNTAGMPAALAEASRRTGKPHVIGEFGHHWDWSHQFNAMEPAFSRDLVLGMWLGLFSPTPILPLTWWWEYFEDRGALSCLGAVRAASDEMLAAGGGDFATLDWPEAAGWSLMALRTGDLVWVLAVRDLAGPCSGADLPLALPARQLDYLNPAGGGWIPHGVPAGLPVSTVGPGEIRVFRLQTGD